MYIIDQILTVIIMLLISGGCMFVTYLNLYCKEEIWNEIYERMDLNETDTV